MWCHTRRPRAWSTRKRHSQTPHEVWPPCGVKWRLPRMQNLWNGSFEKWKKKTYYFNRSNMPKRHSDKTVFGQHGILMFWENGILTFWHAKGLSEIKLASKRLYATLTNAENGVDCFCKRLDNEVVLSCKLSLWQLKFSVSFPPNLGTKPNWAKLRIGVTRLCLSEAWLSFVVTSVAVWLLHLRSSVFLCSLLS